MIYFLILVLFTFFLIEFYFKKSFVSPRLVLVSSLLFSSILMYVNRFEWEVVLSWKFIFYILSSVIFFYIGSTLPSILKYNRFENLPFVLSIMAQPSIFLLLISSLASILYIISTISGLSISTNFTQLLHEIYVKNVENNGSNTFLGNQYVFIVTSICKINIFQFFLNKYIVKKKVNNYIWYLGVVLFIIVAIISTDRNIMVRFLIYAFALWLLFFTTSEKINTINIKIVFRSILFIVITMVIFYLLGRSKNYTSDFSRVLGLYGGSGLYNFNIYLRTNDLFELEYGEKTLASLRSVLAAIGLLSRSEHEVFFEPFIEFRSSTGFVYVSNIYSALKFYVMDFGYFGILIFPTVMGSFFGVLYQKILKRPYGFYWILYCLFLYSLVYFAIDEQFFRRFHFGMLYEIFWISIFYNYIKNRKYSKDIK